MFKFERLELLGPHTPSDTRSESSLDSVPSIHLCRSRTFANRQTVARSNGSVFELDLNSAIKPLRLKELKTKQVKTTEKNK